MYRPLVKQVGVLDLDKLCNGSVYCVTLFGSNINAVCDLVGRPADFRPSAVCTLLQLMRSPPPLPLRHRRLRLLLQYPRSDALLHLLSSLFPAHHRTLPRPQALAAVLAGRGNAAAHIGATAAVGGGGSSGFTAAPSIVMLSDILGMKRDWLVPQRRHLRVPASGESVAASSQAGGCSQRPQYFLPPKSIHLGPTGDSHVLAIQLCYFLPLALNSSCIAQQRWQCRRHDDPILR